MSKKGLHFESVTVLKTGGSFCVVHHKTNSISEHTRLRLQEGHVTCTLHNGESKDKSSHTDERVNFIFFSTLVSST